MLDAITIYSDSLTKSAHPLLFGRISCILYSDKVYSNEHSHWFKLHMASALYLGGRERGREKGRGVRSTASSAMHIGSKELCVTLFLNVITQWLFVDACC